MTENQLEAHFIFAILGVSIPVIGFLIAMALTLRAKRKRETEVNRIREEMINPEKRKNGKH